MNYAFIDGNNLHLGIRAKGWLLDYRKFRVYLNEKYQIQNAYIFLGFLAENYVLYKKLQEQGFVLIFKPTLKTAEGKVKGNCDAELVLQAMIDYPHYAKAVIVTSDGDFACLVDYLYANKKLERVLSPYAKCSVLLRRSAKGRLAYMDNLKPKLEYIK